MYLNCKSYFSYLYGTFSTESLVQAAVEAGASTAALTNINNTADAWDYVRICAEVGIKPVLGAEVRNEGTFLYILLAKSNEGFAQLNRFLSDHLKVEKPFPARPTGLIDVYVIYPLEGSEPETLGEMERIGVKEKEKNRLFGKPLATYGHKYVVLQPVTFADKSYHNVHKLLRAIDLNVTGTRIPDSALAGTDETFVPQSKLMAQFSAFPQLLTNTLLLLDSCQIEMDFGVDKNKVAFSASKEDDRVLLEKLAKDGLLYRYGPGNKEAAGRVSGELKVINDLGFNSYFLMAHDLVRYASSRGFYYVGRGSGANSIVSFCMKITDVDPIELDLYFERFLNSSRTSPPDFDMDFSHRDRDEVIDYVFKRYGKDHVVLLGMHTTFKFRAAVRELGKVFGLPKAEIDMLAEGRFQAGDRIHALILHFGRLIQGFPKNHSIHPGGILISEKPIYYYTSVTMPPKGFPTAHIDMFVAERIGLHKLDVLSQRGLGHIKEAIELIRLRHGKDVDIHNMAALKNDPRIAAQIKSADTIGCFYIESPSMRQVLKKLQCSDYLTLVAASSIIRPGVGESGMMQQYIHRFRNPHDFKYLHPVMEEQLRETYGVMIYQEDVIRIGHFYGGLTLAEADVLRRAMSGKYQGTKEMDALERRFFENCAQMGRPADITKEVWRQIKSFAGYSFSKAHSASYAVESYQSLFLKTYYPVEFMIAVINNWGGFYNRQIYFHELKRTGIQVEPPCVNRSLVQTSIANGIVYMGLEFIHKLEGKLIEKILQERYAAGPFRGLQDFMERIDPSIEQISVLIKTGAFRFTGKAKKYLLWEANFMGANTQLRVGQGGKLFEEPTEEFELPQLPHYPLEDYYTEIELLGFPLGNIYDLLDDDVSVYPGAAELPSCVGQQVVTIGYLVTSKDTVTKKGVKQRMFFGCFLDKEGQWLDTVHFPAAAARYPLQGEGFYRLHGKVIEEFGVYTIAVEQMEKVGIKPFR
ncbi:DNA polymerase III subunit alpha [Pseudoflavitalea sp. X16]|uniref:DNA polymerase III subunit alpha n=1 Tax=Paraflavitalea devenefica TaxID=2716334 RepID=UPI00141E3FFC|nr:DNA polymerase III subunit alpha [Paraflavitalea devenefica]NII26201.1 DNA polymerase III subunit alpha [Paraflavitalea devenefica]